MRSRFALALLISAILAGASVPAGAASDTAKSKMMMGMEGVFNFGYKASRMHMEGSRSGTNRLSNAEVLTTFPVTPVRMIKYMHMFSGMYGLTNDLTLVAMVPYVDIAMKHLNRAGVNFTTKSKGIGDVSLLGMYRILRSGNHEFLVSGGVSLPTGSIDKTDTTPAGPNRPLPYAMQPGSGTFDLLPGLTYRGRAGAYSWGGKASAVLRIGDNDANYTFGDRYRVSAWGARRWVDWFSTSLRVNYETRANVDGADVRLNPAMVPTANANLLGGDRVDLIGGVTFIGTGGLIKGQRLFVEFGAPIYQKIDGPQLEVDWVLSAGIKLRF